MARRGLPAIKDLVVDRRSFDRIIAAGGYISVSTGNAPDGNAILVSKDTSDRAMDAAACIGCGACVAACPNASSALFTGAKIAHLSILPQGVPERDRRALNMVAQMNVEGFWRLHQHRRVHGRVPEGDSAGGDRDHEPRLHPRKLEAARPRGADGDADDGVEHGIEAEDRSARYELGLAVPATAPLARIVGFAAFGRSRLDLREKASRLQVPSELSASFSLPSE